MLDPTLLWHLAANLSEGQVDAPWWQFWAAIAGIVACFIAALGVSMRLAKGWAKAARNWIREEAVKPVLDQQEEKLWAPVREMQHQVQKNHHVSSPPTLRDNLDRVEGKLDTHIEFAERTVQEGQQTQLEMWRAIALHNNGNGNGGSDQ